MCLIYNLKKTKSQKHDACTHQFVEDRRHCIYRRSNGLDCRPSPRPEEASGRNLRLSNYIPFLLTVELPSCFHPSSSLMIQWQRFQPPPSEKDTASTPVASIISAYFSGNKMNQSVKGYLAQNIIIPNNKTALNKSKLTTVSPIDLLTSPFSIA